MNFFLLTSFIFITFLLKSILLKFRNKNVVAIYVCFKFCLENSRIKKNNIHTYYFLNSQETFIPYINCIYVVLHKFNTFIPLYNDLLPLWLEAVSKRIGILLQFSSLFFFYIYFTNQRQFANFSSSGFHA